MHLKKQISLEQAQVGQTLAADVNDAQGNRLIAAGVALSDKVLDSLRRRGVETLAVWGPALSEAEISARQADIKARLAHRFRQVQGNPEMQQLHDILLRWRLEELTS